MDIAGLHPGDFSVTVDPATTIGKNATSTFTIRFAPTTGGLREATVSIATNQTDGRNPYTFAIQGTGNVSVSAPTVTNDNFTAITATSADLSATVTSDGGDTLTVRGFAWNTSGSPTTADNTVSAAGPTPSPVR